MIDLAGNSTGDETCQEKWSAWEDEVVTPPIYLIISLFVLSALRDVSWEDNAVAACTCLEEFRKVMLKSSKMMFIYTMETNSESVSLSISPSSFLPSLHSTPSPYKRQHRTLTTHWLTHWLTHSRTNIHCPQSFISDYQIFMWLQIRVGAKGWVRKKKQKGLEKQSIYSEDE